MAIQIIDPLEVGKIEKKRTPVFNSRKAHAWVHYYTPGQHDELHCHNADQVFICIDGECTMSFPDGTSTVMKPGTAALINGGSFYRLENTGKGPMTLMGWRTGSEEQVLTIDFATRRKVVFENGQAILTETATASELQ